MGETEGTPRTRIWLVMRAEFLMRIPVSTSTHSNLSLAPREHIPRCTSPNTGIPGRGHVQNPETPVWVRSWFTTGHSSLRRKKLRWLQGPEISWWEATRTLSKMRWVGAPTDVLHLRGGTLDWYSSSCGYRCEKGRRDCSKRKRSHNPTQFSLKTKGARRGGTRFIDGSSVHLGVTVHAGRRKGRRIQVLGGARNKSGA